MADLLPAVILLIAVTRPVSSIGTCVIRPYNETHVMACPDPQPAKHELVCHIKHLGHKRGAIVRNGALFKTDFPCELREDCYVISKDTCPKNGYSIILKINGVNNPAQCTEIMYSTLLSPDPTTTNSLIKVTAVEMSTGTVVSIVVATIILVVLAFVVYYKYCKKENDHGDPDESYKHQDTKVMENGDTNSVSILLGDVAGVHSAAWKEEDAMADQEIEPCRSRIYQGTDD